MSLIEKSEHSPQAQSVNLPLSESETSVVRRIYTVYVRTTESVSDRRHKLNLYFLSINAAILGISGHPVTAAYRASILLTIAGLFSSTAWLFTLRSYRKINAAKFEVISKLEQRLPASPFTDEWHLLRYGSRRQRHTHLTTLELTIPLVFMVLHCATLTSEIDWKASVLHDWISAVLQRLVPLVQ